MWAIFVRCCAKNMVVPGMLGGLLVGFDLAFGMEVVRTCHDLL